jgi:hypothetical protein
MGALLENYYAIGHASAGNYIAQVSGQAPDLGTQADCPVWIPFPGQVVTGPYHQILGEGCVYPAAVPTLGNQLSGAGRSWAAHLQDMGIDAGRDNTVSTARGPACGHPATWSADRTRHAERGDQYAARHDGFAFFRSVTADPAFCAAHILLFRPLPGDLARTSATPAFSLLAPNLCNDGHDAPCADGAPGGLAQANRFLAHWVPVIIAAPAYRDGGLIVITFDEGSGTAACCGENFGLGPSHPSVPLPGKTGPAAAASARSCCPRSSGPAPSAPFRTIIIRCCALSRTSSACRTWATRPCRRPGPSARTYSARSRCAPGVRRMVARPHGCVGRAWTSFLTLRRWRARVQGIGDLPGPGRLQGRRLGLVDRIAGEVDRVGGAGLGPLSPPFGGFCVKVVPLLLEPGPYLLELLLHGLRQQVR